MGYLPLYLLTEGGGSASVGYSDVITTLTGQLNNTNLVGILQSILLITLPLGVLWFAVRKAVRLISSAFKKGRIKV